MNNLNIEGLLSRGLMVEPVVPAADLVKLVRRFSPKRTEHSLVRVGSAFDGGYLIPDDLDGVVACFSPGVFNCADFEIDLLGRYGINSYQADYSVDGPPDGYIPLSFVKKFIGAYDDDMFMTMSRWMKGVWEYDLGADFILQMDIEGAEYESLLATPDELLKRFRTIVVEIHNLDKWGLPQFYSISNALIGKLLQHFVVVHVHPNNYGGMVVVNGVELPRTIEVTLHRRDRCKIVTDNNEFPHFLDAPCSPMMPDVILPSAFLI